MSYNWNWGVLFQEPYFGWILTGFATTCVISLLAWTVAFVAGSVIGVARTVPSRTVRGLATLYVEVFRNVPVLVQLFLWFYAFPELLPNDVGRFIKRDLPYPELWFATVGLGLYTASRVAEQVRSGINSIPAGQTLAALALGLTRPQVYRFVLLPVGIRTILPSLTNDFLGTFKNSSLLLTIGVLELTVQTRRVDEYTFQSFEAFICATVLYCSITLSVTAVMRHAERRSSGIGTITAGGGGRAKRV